MRIRRSISKTLVGALVLVAFSAAPALATEPPFLYPGSTSAPLQDITPISATLNTEVDPEGQPVEFFYEYSTEATGETLKGTIVKVVGETLPPEGGEVEARVNTGPVLAPETKYYFRIVAKNGNGTVEGPVAEFTTEAAKPPVVLSESAHNAAEPSLEAKINPEYGATTYKFEYSSEEAGGVLTGAIHTVAGASTLPVVNEALSAGPVAVAGLAPGRYFYRAVAENATSEAKSEPAYGPVQEFQAYGTPLVTTGAAQFTTHADASLSGTIDPQGLFTTYHFTYVPAADYRPGAGECQDGAACAFAAGRDTYETRLTEAGVPLTDYSSHPILAVGLEELAPETTYVYALVATNEAGTTVGPPATFTTPAAPAAPAPAVAQAEPIPLAPALAPATVLPFVPYTSLAQLDANEAKEAKGLPAPAVTKSLTRGQKLSKALRGCRKEPKAKRAKCVRQAHKRD